MKTMTNSANITTVPVGEALADPAQPAADTLAAVGASVLEITVSTPVLDQQKPSGEASKPTYYHSAADLAYRAMLVRQGRRLGPSSIHGAQKDAA